MGSPKDSRHSWHPIKLPRVEIITIRPYKSHSNISCRMVTLRTRLRVAIGLHTKLPSRMAISQDNEIKTKREEEQQKLPSGGKGFLLWKSTLL
jgi:hypothetical protein